MSGIRMLAEVHPSDMASTAWRALQMLREIHDYSALLRGGPRQFCDDEEMSAIEECIYALRAIHTRNLPPLSGDVPNRYCAQCWLNDSGKFAMEGGRCPNCGRDYGQVPGQSTGHTQEATEDSR